MKDYVTVNCPGCNAGHEWNGDVQRFDDASEEVGILPDGRKVTAWVCVHPRKETGRACRSVVGMAVATDITEPTDHFGVYTFNTDIEEAP